MHAARAGALPSLAWRGFAVMAQSRSPYRCIVVALNAQTPKLRGFSKPGRRKMPPRQSATEQARALSLHEIMQRIRNKVLSMMWRGCAARRAIYAGVRGATARKMHVFFFRRRPASPARPPPLSSPFRSPCRVPHPSSTRNNHRRGHAFNTLGIHILWRDRKPASSAVARAGCGLPLHKKRNTRHHRSSERARKKHARARPSLRVLNWRRG